MFNPLLLELIDQLVEAGINLRITPFGVFFESGFYKSDGCSYLKVDSSGAVVLHSRYNEVAQIDDMGDIVRQSYEWYERSRSRFDGWSVPSPEWHALYEHHNCY